MTSKIRTSNSGSSANLLALAAPHLALGACRSDAALVYPLGGIRFYVRYFAPSFARCESSR